LYTGSEKDLSTGMTLIRFQISGINVISGELPLGFRNDAPARSPDHPITRSRPAL
jgi:hypothetical protein